MHRSQWARMERNEKEWEIMAMQKYKVERSGILDWCSFSYGTWEHSTKQGMISNHEGYNKGVERCSIVRIIRSETHIDLRIINAL